MPNILAFTDKSVPEVLGSVLGHHGRPEVGEEDPPRPPNPLERLHGAPDILGFMDKSVPEVLGTMVGIQVSPGVGEEEACRPSILDGVTGSVSLTGKVNGVVYTAFSDTLAQAVAERILGIADAEESDVSDVIGELTNMITGNLKSQLTDLGYNCQLSIPTVMRSGHISIVAKDAPLSIRNTYFLETLGEFLTVQVLARIQT